MPERAGGKYEAIVESSSQAVNVSSGSTLMQLGVDNANGDLLPGAFANVSMELPSNAAAAHSIERLLFNNNGLRVATLDRDKIRLKKVTIARDLGLVIELGSGLAGDDRVIQSPPDGIVDGDPVRVAEAPKSAAPVSAPANR